MHGSCGLYVSGGDRISILKNLCRLEINIIIVFLTKKNKLATLQKLNFHYQQRIYSFLLLFKYICIV